MDGEYTMTEEQLHISEDLHLTKWMEYLAHVKENQPCNLSVISMESRTTYSHVVKEVKKLEKMGLVETKPIGREKLIELTKKGNDIFHALKRGGVFYYE